MLGLLTIAAAIVSPQAVELSGSLPVSIDAVSRVVWISAREETDDGTCEVASQKRWHCDIAAGAAGLVVFVNGSSVAFTAIGLHADDTVRRWGRVVRVQAGAVDPVNLHDLRVTAWVPERSTARPHTQRLVPTEDSQVTVIPLSPTSFWVAGGADPQPDAYVQLAGRSIASVHVSTRLLASDSPDIPVLIAVDHPQTLDGRVETVERQAVADAQVDLYMRLVDARPDESWAVADLVRTRRTTTTADGSFRFDGLSIGTYLIVASHRTLGRGELVVSSSDGLAVVRLTPPSRITGRVLKDSLPVPAARVRFVPDINAWTDSVDPTRHITEETLTDEEGRFSLALPAVSSGFLQIIAPDGAMKRLPVSQPKHTTEIALGDIALPEHRRLDVRLLTGGACDLFATGPLGSLGLTIVRATSVSSVFSFDLPEPGQWSLTAECSGRVVTVQPGMVAVAPEGPFPTVDVVVMVPKR